MMERPCPGVSLPEVRARSHSISKPELVDPPLKVQPIQRLTTYAQDPCDIGKLTLRTGFLRTRASR